MNAALGLRFAPDFFAAGFFAGAFFAAFFAGAFFAAGFFAGFLAAGFFAGFFAAFLAVAMVLLPRGRCGMHCIERSEADPSCHGESCSIGGNYSAIPREGNPSQEVFSLCARGVLHSWRERPRRASGAPTAPECARGATSRRAHGQRRRQSPLSRNAGGGTLAAPRSEDRCQRYTLSPCGSRRCRARLPSAPAPCRFSTRTCTTTSKRRPPIRSRRCCAGSASPASPRFSRRAGRTTEPGHSSPRRRPIRDRHRA